MSELDMPTGWLKIIHDPLYGYGWHFEDHQGTMHGDFRLTRRGAIRAAKRHLHQITTKETTNAR